MRRHLAIVLVVCGLLLVLAIFLIVGALSGGDAGNAENQPVSGLARLAAV